MGWSPNPDQYPTRNATGHRLTQLYLLDMRVSIMRPSAQGISSQRSLG